MSTSTAFGINGAGQVVGTSSAGTGVIRAFLWSAGAMQELPPPLGYCCSEAFAINDDGLVAGAVSITPGNPHAAIWRNGVATDLQKSGPGEGYAWDVNASGRIVGTFYSDFDGGSQGSFTWTESSGLQLLDGTADGGEALAISEAGRIVGWSRGVAYFWSEGLRDVLGTLGGGSSVALGVNDAPTVQIVGGSSVQRGADFHAFIWSESGGMRDLGLPKGRSFARAEDVNATGWVVGWTSSRSGAERATLWKVAAP
jgi:probable HAF family extracellular repeat protein